MSPFEVDVVLFDLDGTLADTAPDLVAAVNRVRATLSLPPVPDERVRPYVSKGARAMLQAGIPERPEAQLEQLERFLACYGERANAATRLYPDIDRVIEALEARGRPWGIVTNKPGYLTQPLLVSLGIDRRAAVVVSGDSLPVKKPDPAPVRHACDVLGIAPARAVLVGDDRRDVDSAHAAGALAIVAAWGYLGDEDDVATWGGDAIAERPGDLLRLLGLA